MNMAKKLKNNRGGHESLESRALNTLAGTQKYFSQDSLRAYENTLYSTFRKPNIYFLETENSTELILTK